MYAEKINKTGIFGQTNKYADGWITNLINKELNCQRYEIRPCRQMNKRPVDK